MPFFLQTNSPSLLWLHKGSYGTKKGSYQIECKNIFEIMASSDIPDPEIGSGRNGALGSDFGLGNNIPIE